MAVEAGSDPIGGGLIHKSQGYPFVTTPRLVKVLWLLVVTVAWAAVATACAADSPGQQADPALTTQRTIPEENSTTAPTADDQPVLTTEPEALPEPEWAETEFVLQPIAQTNGALAMAVRTGGDDLWLVEREGRVRVVQRRVSLDGEQEAVKLMNTVVLDISDRVGTDGEGGLLGLDFSPDGRHLYVSYTNTSGTSVIAEYQMDLLTAVADSERILLEVEQPYSNHNGGQITVGPDGFLYIALGDGGSGGDPLGSGQDTSTLLGSILRIDPVGGSAEAAYGVPADNPFVERTGLRDEIWLYGVRNPWRFSFDAASGDLWIGDVGQGEIEEIDFLPASVNEPAGRRANLGWNIMEGEERFSGENPPPDHIGPIAWYGHENGRCSVTGGYVYRGDEIAELDGVYIFGDYCTGEVFGLKRFRDGRTTQAPLTIDGGPGQIVSFGQGPENELYILEADGTVSRLQTRGWERAIEVYTSDEEIPGGAFEIEDIRPGPDDPVINSDPALDEEPESDQDPGEEAETTEEEAGETP